MGELGVEEVDLRLGDLGGELGEGTLGLLLAVERGDSDASEPMHVASCRGEDEVL